MPRRLFAFAAILLTAPAFGQDSGGGARLLAPRAAFRLL
jgi:hypothetical protein